MGILPRRTINSIPFLCYIVIELSDFIYNNIKKEQVITVVVLLTVVEHFS